MSTAARPRTPRLAATLREKESVTPLELFFDLVFVLALTQCTALMADEPTWEGLAKALLVLAVLWWSWSGYAWLTSLVDPEEGVVRIAMFGAMAAFLVAALCVPEAFDDSALIFALAYAGVRERAHRAVRDRQPRRPEPARVGDRAGDQHARSASGCWSPRRSPTARCRARSGASRSCSTTAGPYFFGVEGWRMMPSHFAERFGLIVIIALGESIVAIGVGVESEVDAGHRRRRGARHGRGGRAVVAVLRRRRARRRAPALEGGARPRAQLDRPRLLRLPAPADGGRDRAAGARAEEDARARRGPAQARARGRAARRHRDVPRRPRRVPPAQRPPLQRPAAAVRGRAGRADPGRGRARRRWRRSRSSPRCSWR